MSISRAIVRYLVMAIAVLCLAVGLNNCATSSPTATAPTTTAPTTPETTAESATAPNGDPQININSAILSELDKLEAKLGIPALSNKIQASRPYAKVEELVSKQVITQAQFDHIKNDITTVEVVLTGEAKDVDYMTKLGLMRGHMLVAGELLKLNEPKQAEPHLGHPVEEIYVDIQEQLSERNVKEFSDVLTKVQDLVKSKPQDSQVQPAYEAAVKAIDGAIAALPATQRSSPAFMLKVVNEMLDTAAAEYTAAISDGKFSAAIEYQDSRGFVQYAKDTLLKDIEPALKKEKSVDGNKLKSALDDLYKAWPNPIPPQAPLISAEQLGTQVKAIEKESAALL
jgi:Helix-hairpin-helix motif